MTLPPVLFTEARLSPTPTSPFSILPIHSSGNSQQATLSGAGRKRPFEEITGHDEASYARRHLATEASVFFRRKKRSPRSFLWRVLDDRQLLEVQGVELVQEKKQARQEGSLTFHIALPAPIVQGGVAFAEPEETDALDVFVLTTGNELYTITLKRDLLARESPPAEVDPTTCVKKYAPGSFSFRHPYRFVAVSTRELLISLHDGGLMRFERGPNDKGTQWRETFFSEGGWGGTLRGLIPIKRHQTVRYGNLDLETNAVAAMAKSPDGVYVWTISLDHMLKAWSTKTGKVVSQMDLLNERQDKESHRRAAQYVMAAEQGTLLQVVGVPSPTGSGQALAKMEEDGRYYLVVHSPKDHQFKFYEVSTTITSVEGEGLRLDDLHPRSKLVPPIDDLMDTNIWHLEEFYIKPGVEWQGSQIWLRARSGALCKVFTLTFDMFETGGDSLEIEELWQCGWSVVDPGPTTARRLRQSVDFPAGSEGKADVATTPSERWLDFLFFPGRFGTSSLETALYVYRKGRGLPANSGRRLNTLEQPLKERMTVAVTSKVILKRSAGDQPDFAAYQRDIQVQWSNFYSVLEQLCERGQESISLAYDAEQELAWSVGADFVAPIRACSQLELLHLNTKLSPDDEIEKIDGSVAMRIFSTKEDQAVSQLIEAAHEFRRRLSAGFQTRFKAAADVDAQTYSISVEIQPDQLQAMFDRCAFADEVANENFEALVAATENLGGLGNLNDDVFLAVVERLDESADRNSADGRQRLQRYGVKFTVAVAQETLQQVESTLLDLLALVVFMGVDLEPEELHNGFNAVQIYETILLKLKYNTLRTWFAKHTSLPPVRDASNEQAETSLLESLFIDTWSARSQTKDTSLPELLTAWSKHWIFQTDLHREWNGLTAHCFGVLLKAKSFDLAADFSRFLTDLPWPTYLKARLYVAAGDYVLAALNFRAAAEGMGLPERLGKMEFDTAALLSAEERNHFGKGLDRYFEHVAAVFEKLKCYSYVAEFASLALLHLDGGDDFEQSLAEIDMRKSMVDSPAQRVVDDTIEELRLLRVRRDKDELLSRLYNALVQTARFAEAFRAMVQIRDPEMQRADLQQLIKSCVAQDAVPSLLDLPLEGELAQTADGVLLNLAKRSLASATSLSTSAPYHQILYAYRSQRADFRGAAEILYEHLERVRHSSQRGIQDPEDEAVTQAYVLLINTLACCGESEGWLLAEPIEGVHEGGRKRRLVTIEQVRRDYGAELDRRSEVLMGRFPLLAGGEQDVEML